MKILVTGGTGTHGRHVVRDNLDLTPDGERGTRTWEEFLADR
ncbi:hypothetical protein [Lentzea sp. NEAU-D7]|nr:hypothetical protein [Lentzea sp. NEAU-D7]MCX2947659.1 hypothetical protein [Lentzea sp. NEAU-D7]